MLRTALADRDPLVVREPGGTRLGESIRALLLQGAPMTAEAEMHLFMAARSELLEERIKPALAAGRVVIDDRYHDSTLAYQGGGRGVATYWPESFPKPDLTILLELPAGAGLERLRSSGKQLDRLDAEPAAFHAAVAAAYTRLAAAEPDRWLRVDAAQPPELVHRAIMERVRGLLER
jgi:dTMP kinase